jgi:predicted ATPase
MINTIAGSIKMAARNNSQFIIATHSPMLLKCFDIDDILVFEKDEHNKTIVTKKTEADFEDWSDDFLLGQLWLSGKIGGKRW